MSGVVDETSRWRVIYGKNDPLSNFWEFLFFFSGTYYRIGVEQAYHHQRALKENQNLANQILNACTVSEVKLLSRQIKSRVLDSDQQKADVDLMRVMLSQKTRQCKAFRDELRKSGNSVLVHSTYAPDKFWASGKHHDVLSFPDGFEGRNMHGRLITFERENLQTEPKYDCDTVMPMPSRTYATAVSCSSAAAVSSTVSGYKAGVAQRQKSMNCWTCGEPGHKQTDCGHWKRDGRCLCSKCGKPGHKWKRCPQTGPSARQDKQLSGRVVGFGLSGTSRRGGLLSTPVSMQQLLSKRGYTTPITHSLPHPHPPPPPPPYTTPKTYPVSQFQVRGSSSSHVVQASWV